MILKSISRILSDFKHYAPEVFYESREGIVVASQTPDLLRMREYVIKEDLLPDY